MSDTVVLNPEVVDFVAKVRHHLRNLPEEERDELTDGLEADLGELVAEQGSGALGDPAAYAAELRVAAGLEVNGRRPAKPVEALIDSLLDRAHAHWDGALARIPGHPTDFLVAVRPAWWVLRAWIAVEMLDLTLGGHPYDWIPHIFGFGWVVVLLTVVLSVQLGRGVLPLGPFRGLARRLLLLALNLFAVVCLLAVLDQLPTSSDVTDAYSTGAYSVPHLAFNGQSVQNVYPYDADGQPLTGVQLVDQKGQRLSVAGTLCGDYWTNGNKRVFSAFPVPARTYHGEGGQCSGSTAITFPLASLPPVSLPASVAAATTGAPADLSPSSTP